jgi:bifunctional non-homologous end joining protein LigD
MPLDEYRKKRTFGITPEPAGRKKKRTRIAQPIFVVQKHEASQLHYDFRLEIDGVLASWAIPKGPSLSTTEKRLAMRTEDHPMEYADFEGLIPEGQYGAGTVMVWDMGTYKLESDDSAGEQLARGELKFTLDGQKLCGRFVLIRSGARDEKRWLLIKRQDECANRSWKIDRDLKSALTRRTMKEIASGRALKKSHV